MTKKSNTLQSKEKSNSIANNSFDEDENKFI